MKECKTCGKALIGREKVFCKSCRTKGIDTAKKGILAVGGIALMAVAIVTKSDKISGIVKRITKDI